MPDELKEALAEQFRKTKVILMGFSEFPDDPKIEALPSVKNNLKGLRECFLNPEIVGIPEENILVIDENSDVNILSTLKAELVSWKDTIIVYYAGHGFTRDDGQFCLSTHKTKIDDRDYTTIDFGEVHKILKRSQARIKILILDCCFSGHATIDIAGMSDIHSVIQAEISQLKGTYVIASTPATRTSLAFDEEKQYTVFTGELLNVLQTGIDKPDPHVLIDELFDVVYERLTSKARPEPQKLVVQHAGKYPFARNRKYPLPPEEEIEITFQNREYELNRIEQTLEDVGIDPYIHIFEPAQTGKTYLLNRLKEKYSRLDKWEVIDVGLTETALEWEEADLFRLFAERLQASIALRSGKAGENSTETGEITSDALCEMVIKRYVNYQKRMLFLIDNIEFLNDALTPSLSELLKSLRNYFEGVPSHYQPGFVFAGRRTFPIFKNGFLPHFQRVELSPLTAKVVVILLMEVSKKLHKRLGRKSASSIFTREWYQNRAEEIIRCSSGHPGCMAALIRRFYRKEFGITNLNSDQIFRETISPIIQKEILNYEKLMGARVEKISQSDFQRLIKVLLVLSLYRIIIPPHIEEAAKKLKLKLSAEELRSVEDDVDRCLVIQVDDNRVVWLMHRIVRQLLFRYRTLGKKTSLLHANAAEYYQELLKDARYAVSNDDQITFMVEILYHFALSRETADNSLLDFLKTQLEKLSTRLSTHIAHTALRQRLEKDRELRQTIAARFGPHAYTELLSVLKKKRANPGGTE